MVEQAKSLMRKYRTIVILLPIRMTLYRNTSDHYNVQATPLIIKTSTKLCSQKSHHDNDAPLIMGLYETIRNIGNF